MDERGEAAVRIGLVGHGMWVRMYLLPGLLRCKDADVVALCGRDDQRAAATARELGVERSYRDVRRMVQAEDLDALVIASPPAMHEEAVEAAAAAWIAVYCEKPLGLDARQSARIAAAASQVPSMVGFTLRWNRALQGVRDYVLDGGVGRIRHVRIDYRQASSPHGVGWRRGPAAEPNGVLSDLGPHVFDLVRWLGMEFIAVSGVGNRIVAGGNLDECHLLANLTAGATASLACSRISPSDGAPGRTCVVVLGETGWVSCDFGAGAAVRVGGYGGPAEILAQCEAPVPEDPEVDASSDGGAVRETGGAQMPAEMFKRLLDGANRQMSDFVGLAPGGDTDRRRDLPTLGDGHASAAGRRRRGGGHPVGSVGGASG